MTHEVDFDRLRDSFPRLYRVVAKTIGLVEPRGGTYAVDFSKLSDFTRGELSAWLNAYPLQKEASTPPPQPPVAAQEELPEQIDMSEILREEQAEIQKSIDEARGRNRLEEYKEAGLEDTKANADLIRNFVQQSAVHGYWSREIVDAAIQNLGTKGTNQLTWRPKTVEPPPPALAPEPAEVLGTLPDGTKQLPLDVDNRTLSKASKDQAGDWLKRTKVGKLRPRGSFSSLF